jgi:Phage major capsid protein E
MDIFSTDALNAVVQDLRMPQTGLASAYFGNAMQDDTEEIHFDVDNKPRRIAPFVSPLVAGQVVQSRGYSTKTFKPAYIKDKRVFTPQRALRRAMGERIGGGGMSPEERMNMLVVQDMQDQLEMIERRMEWMACQALYGGSVTVAGDQYPSVVVDFGRAAGHSVTLAGAARWGQAGIKPLDDLQTWSDTMVQNTGVALTEVTMTVDAWKIFRADADVKTRLDRFRGNSTLQADALVRGPDQRHRNRHAAGLHGYRLRGPGAGGGRAPVRRHPGPRRPARAGVLRQELALARPEHALPAHAERTVARAVPRERHVPRHRQLIGAHTMKLIAVCTVVSGKPGALVSTAPGGEFEADDDEAKGLVERGHAKPTDLKKEPKTEPKKEPTK